MRGGRLTTKLKLFGGHSHSSGAGSVLRQTVSSGACLRCFLKLWDAASYRAR